MQFDKVQAEEPLVVLKLSEYEAIINTLEYISNDPVLGSKLNGNKKDNVKSQLPHKFYLCDWK